MLINKKIKERQVLLLPLVREGGSVCSPFTKVFFESILLLIVVINKIEKKEKLGGIERKREK